MTKLLVYLLESSLLMAAFYVPYRAVLHHETFFNLNRAYLLALLVFAIALPMVSVNLFPNQLGLVNQPVESLQNVRHLYADAFDAWAYHLATVMPDADSQKIEMAIISTSNHSFKVLLWVYGFGVAISLLRLLWVLMGIARMIIRHPRSKLHGMNVVQLSSRVSPFSFFNFVFVHHSLVKSDDLTQILAHERIHVRQGHSFDIIFVQLVAAIFWFNPIIWHLFKSLKTIHEYIADNKTIKSGYSLEGYQTLLLQQLISNNPYGLVHNFNLSFIKKRITMMTNKQSGWTGKVKVALAIFFSTIIGTLIVQCNSKSEDQLSLDTSQGGSATKVIELPTIPYNSITAPVINDDKFSIFIANDVVTIDGKERLIEEIAPLIEKFGLSEQGVVALHITKTQNMDIVGKVQAELRKADRRKVLYETLSSTNEPTQVPLLLPPAPEHVNARYPAQPSLEELEAQGKYSILKVDVSKANVPSTKNESYEFVKAHADKQSMDYVVSIKYEGNDNFDDYIASIVHVREAFAEIYQERAMKMYGKDFSTLSREEHIEVRKGLPMAISIAEY